MLEKVKYDIGTKVRAKTHCLNDPRSEVDAVICEIRVGSDMIGYSIKIPPTEEYKKNGCTGCTGYVNQDDILGLCQ